MLLGIVVLAADFWHPAASEVLSRQALLIVIPPGTTAAPSVAIRHRVEAAIGSNRPLSSSERIHVGICAQIIVDVTVRIRLVVTLHECAVVSVIRAHIMVPLRIGRDH